MNEKCFTCVLSERCKMAESDAEIRQERCDELIFEEHEKRREDYRLDFLAYLEEFDSSL